MTSDCIHKLSTTNQIRLISAQTRRFTAQYTKPAPNPNTGRASETTQSFLSIAESFVLRARCSSAIKRKMSGKMNNVAKTMSNRPVPNAYSASVKFVSDARLKSDRITNGNETNAPSNGVNNIQNVQRFQMYQYHTAVNGLITIATIQYTFCNLVAWGVAQACPIPHPQNKRYATAEKPKMMW